MFSVVPATLDHALELAPKLRVADVAEIKASSGSNAEDALILSTALTPTAKTWLIDGEVVAMFGVSPVPSRPGMGVPWMVASDLAQKHKIFFLRNCRAYVREMLEEFPLLVNFVDCRNVISIQWLHWCGFALCEVDPFHGAQRLPFIRFQQAR